MTNGIIKNTGNSRRIKSAGLPDTYAELKALWEDSGIPIDLLLSPDGWQQLGTLLNQLNLLSGQTEVALWGNAADRTVNDALRLQETSVHYAVGAKAVDILGNPLGGLAMEKVYETVTAADAPQIDIPLGDINLYDYSSLEVRVRLFNAGASVLQSYLRVNGLTSGYYTRGTTSTSTSSASQLGAALSAPVRSYATAAAICRLHLTPEFNGVSAGVFSEISAMAADTSPNSDWTLGLLRINALSDIQTLNIAAQTGVLTSGCEIIVYGVRR